MPKRKNQKIKLPAPWDKFSHQFELGDIVIADGYQRVLIVGWNDPERKEAVVVNVAGAHNRRFLPMDRMVEQTEPRVPAVHYAKRRKPPNRH